MANFLAEMIAGFMGGILAGIIGYATDIVAGAIFEAFTPFNPLIPLLGLIFAIISFFAGMSEAYTAGVSFSIGIIIVGFLLTDFVTIIAGIISIAGLLLSLLRRSGD